MLIRRTVIVVTVALLATGCRDTADRPSPTPTSAPTVADAPEPVDGLIAEIGTNRLYAVDRALGLVLRNVTDHPVEVSDVRLDSPLFAPLPATRRTVVLSPDGRRVVLPVPYGEVRCDNEPSPTFAVIVTLASGVEVHLDAPEEYDGAVARLHQRECAAADVLERVEITWGDGWVQDGSTTTGELHLAQRHHGQPVAIDDAVGNVIFTLVLGRAHPVLAISDDAPTASVPVTISADRCDPHAVAEFKTPHRFLSWVAVGAAAPVPVPLELTGAARVALDQLIASCST